MVNDDGRGARGCTVDVYDPLRLRKLREWAESDAEFLRKLCITKEDAEKIDKLSASLSLISYSEPSRQSFDERFACRQRYLRSYKFRREKDTIVDKTKKFLFSCIARVESRKS